MAAAAPAPVETDYLLTAVQASFRIASVASITPLSPLPLLSARYGCPMLLKREDLQPIFSFKLRGAYNKMAALPPSLLARGVICASAGNHAQGVALAARALHARATIVMPTLTPALKVDAVRARGGDLVDVVLAGDTFDDAAAHARALEAASGATFVHPFDDPDVIAGQGTVALELLRQVGDAPLDAVFVCVGGGGLLAGIAAVVKRLRPGVRVFGVEATDSDAMAQSLAAGRRVTLPAVGLFADGAAVKTVGAECFRLAQLYADGIVRVDNDAICAAIKDVFDDTRAVLEPAGALGVAGAKAWLAAQRAAGASTCGAVACVASGANVNFDRLRFVAERAEVGEAREAVFAATIPERPGAFRSFIAQLGPVAVTEFNYRFAGGGAPARVFVGVAVASRAAGAAVVARLNAGGVAAADLTDDETAKSHVRYMVGGRADVPGERVWRVTFPERTGALAAFLGALASDIDITLFHYRNHGADFGRVLVGMVSVGGRDAEAAMAGIGYAFEEVTACAAYRLFLGRCELRPM
jgi:threonine dehydratase